MIFVNEFDGSVFGALTMPGIENENEVLAARVLLLTVKTAMTCCPELEQEIFVKEVPVVQETEDGKVI